MWDARIVSFDVNTRRLRYFVAVAEELHFSRAATKLHVAQQALSRQIRELESSLGTDLFIRTTRNVQLTDAGRAFLDAARATLKALDAGATTAQASSLGHSTTLRLGYVVGGALELTEPILNEFAAQQPMAQLQMREYPTTDRTAGLIDASSDVAFVRLPVTAPGIAHEILFEEPLVAAICHGHRLAQRNEITAHELSDETIVIGDGNDPAADAFWSLDSTHKDPTQLLRAHSLTEELALVSTGRAYSITTAAAARYALHPSVHYVRIADSARAALAVAWRAENELPVVADFVTAACLARDRETRTVRLIEHPEPW
jgi:DNA-binding transcriptional LysR family regulator